MGSTEDTRRVLKLGIEVSQATIAKYTRQERPPSADLAHVSGEPRSADSSNRLSGSEDCELSLVVCICGGGSHSLNACKLVAQGHELVPSFSPQRSEPMTDGLDTACGESDSW